MVRLQYCVGVRHTFAFHWFKQVTMTLQLRGRAELAQNKLSFTPCIVMGFYFKYLIYVPPFQHCRCDLHCCGNYLSWWWPSITWENSIVVFCVLKGQYGFGSILLGRYQLNCQHWDFLQQWMFSVYVLGHLEWMCLNHNDKWPTPFHI